MPHLSSSSTAPTRRTRRNAQAAARKRRTATTSAALGMFVLAGSVVAGPAFAQSAPTFERAASHTPVASMTVDADASVAFADVIDEAQLAVADARAATKDAEEVAEEVADSGLDLGDKPATVDTADLEERIDELDAIDSIPALFLPTMTESAVTETVQVRADVAQLRDDLRAAEEQKAAEEAAAQKAAEEAAAAEAAAQAEAEAAAQAAAAAPAPSSEASTQAPAPAPAPAPVVDPGSAQGIAQQMMAANYGWGDGEFSCLVSLWNKESGWNAQAYNASSGAFGIPQALPGDKMASAGADWQTNAATQIAWGLGYIADRYGSPCGAWGHSQSTGWY